MNNKQALQDMIDVAFNEPEQRMVLRNIVNALPDAEEKPAEPDQQYPPAGIAIQVYRNGAWQMAHTLNNMGTAQWGLSSLRLPNEAWRYLPAPDVWPEHALYWAAFDTGSYAWVAWKVDIGDRLHDQGRIIHVEHRPEGE